MYEFTDHGPKGIDESFELMHMPYTYSPPTIIGAGYQQTIPTYQQGPLLGVI